MNKIFIYVLLFLGLVIFCAKGFQEYKKYKEENEILTMQEKLNLLELSAKCDDKYLDQLRSMNVHLLLKKEKFYKKSFALDIQSFDKKISLKCK